ncbi:hypothetical protein ACIRBZ_38335 [Streptomyces sp. NPDC094038]|uniref:hypothetical protein n=1 Tax=Streptomyces sp. NPDC094038 TaxID=3366055 RepID=UPI00380BDFB2
MSRSGRRGPYATRTVEGSEVVALARYGNSSMTTGSGRSFPRARSASIACSQRSNRIGAMLPLYWPSSSPKRRNDSASVASYAQK